MPDYPEDHHCQCVTYNPYKFETFVTVDDEAEIFSARFVSLDIDAKNKVVIVGEKNYFQNKFACA